MNARCVNSRVTIIYLNLAEQETDCWIKFKTRNDYETSVKRFIFTDTFLRKYVRGKYKNNSKDVNKHTYYYQKYVSPRFLCKNAL